MDMFIVCMACMAGGYILRLSQELQKEEVKESSKESKESS